LQHISPKKFLFSWSNYLPESFFGQKVPFCVVLGPILTAKCDAFLKSA
jgi:hypothetical protein